ncbi:RNA-binding protein [Chitinophaga sp. MM2321]|uniref:RNA recognition motif domain-containing protein n=1 Tax=Chitinophaga sp. MM2321 TaxID=3137178 RepID=UPI0032D5881C
MNLYISNLSSYTTEEDLRNLFSKFGAIDSVKIIVDKFTNQSRGFGFIEMPSDAEANEAIQGLNNTEVQGRSLGVAVARPKENNNNNRNNRW